MLHHTSGKKTLFHMWECLIAEISYFMFLLNIIVSLLCILVQARIKQWNYLLCSLYSSWREAAAVLSQGVLEPVQQVLPQDSCFLILLSPTRSVS